MKIPNEEGLWTHDSHGQGERNPGLAMLSLPRVNEGKAGEEVFDKTWN